VEDRQWSVDKNVLRYHPSQVTDPFTLYIKSAMLISRVKTFNVRYKTRRLIEDPDMHDSTQSYGMYNSDLKKSLDALYSFDPRGTVAFRDLDAALVAFKPSFPQQFSSPLRRGTIDGYLYSASIAAFL
jgi:hypothetical protein